MNITIKKFAALLLGMVAINSSAFASDAYYGAPKTPDATKLAAGKGFGQVVLRNYTNYTYMSYAVFQPSGKPSNLGLGQYGSGYDVITYDINYPDNEVCFNIVRDFDSAPIFNGCVPAGKDVNIGPYLAAANADSKMIPPVKITSR